MPPNGWVFSISNEVCMDNLGKIENVGVPVDYELHYPWDKQLFFRGAVDDLAGDRERILAAIERL